MNVLLIQPPDSPPAVASLEPPPGDSRLFSYPWNLLCLRSYLLEHTRHLCTLVDCRFFANLEVELIQAVESAPGASVAVVNTTSLGLGQTAAVLDILKREYPDIRTVVCGQHPSQFPEHVGTMPRVDFGLAGDAESILRNLLDYIDVEQRLRRIPGLILPGERAPKAYWLPDLRSLSLPDWKGIFWKGYGVGSNHSTVRVLARLSRGHTHCPSDRASGDAHEPLRFWPIDRMAAALQRCGHLGVTEVMISDPAGIWTTDRLSHWCSALDAVRNVQPWSLQLLPTHLSEDAVYSLQRTLCTRVEFLYPSCDPAVLRHYGCVISPRELSQTIDLLRGSNIRVHTRFWMAGPEERPGERERVVRTIRSLDFCNYSLHPFPFVLDSPIYQDFAEASATHLDDWVQWSRDPWIMERPVPLWGGAMAAMDLEEDFDWIQRKVQHHPQRLFKRILQGLSARGLISAMEERAVGLISPPSN